MATTIETIFENGVFRPLQPVMIAENRRVLIEFEENPQDGMGDLTRPRLSPREYVDDYPDFADADIEYNSMPPKSINTVEAKIIFAGKMPPAPYPEEE